MRALPDTQATITLPCEPGKEWSLSMRAVVRLLSDPATVAELQWYCPGGHREHPCSKLTRPAEEQRLGTHVTSDVHTATVSEHYERMGLAMPEQPFIVFIGARHLCMSYDRDAPLLARRWKAASFRQEELPCTYLFPRSRC